MSWQINSLIMFIASVFGYLAIRKIGKLNIPSSLSTYCFSALPVLIIGSYMLWNGISFEISLKHLIISAVIGILLSFVGNKFSIIAINAAPNAGYSLIIQKSYAPFSAIMAFLLLGSELKLKAIISFIIIIISISLLIIDNKAQTEKRSRTWIFYSFIPFFAFGLLAVGSKYLINDGMNPVALTFYIFVFAGVAFTINFNTRLFYDLAKMYETNTGRNIMINTSLLLSVILSNAIFNIAMFQAFRDAPNIGYVNIINASSITAITLMSAALFGDKLTARKIIGIIGATVGLAILFL